LLLNFIQPNLPRESFVKIFAAISPEFETQCKKIVDIIYSLDPKVLTSNIAVVIHVPQVKQMGLESEGISSYYSPDIKRSEIDLVQQFMESIKMEYNISRGLNLILTSVHSIHEFSRQANLALS